MIDLKQIFSEILLEGGKNSGRKPKSLTYQEDKEYIENKDQEIKDGSKRKYIAVYIANERKRLLNAFKDNPDFNIDELKTKSLQELSNLISKYNLQTNTRKTNWKVHETAVCDGINTLFQKKFFKLVHKKDNKITDINPEDFKSEPKGGSSFSDIVVKRLSKQNLDFFVECKLDFDTSEYFKYGVTIDKTNIKYNHKKYIEGIKDKEQIKFINELFDTHINISSFLNKLVQSPEIKNTWQKFLDNITEVEQFVKSNNELKQFSSEFTFRQVFPEDFKTFADIFDSYCDFYAEKYNSLINKLFKLFDSDQLKISEYCINSHNTDDKNNVFQTLASLISIISVNNLKINNKKEFDSIIKQIQIIESKFTALLKLLGYSSEDISQIKKLKIDEKTKYFFKLFISSVKRKAKNSNINQILTDKDKFGNMQICSDIVIDTDELARMITNFYVRKDKCAYIQIDNVIYQFVKEFNPFEIEKLPIFKDFMKKFIVSLKINDQLTTIRLHINAIQPDEKLFTSNISKLSFKEKDNNFIMKKLKEIKVEVN